MWLNSKYVHRLESHALFTQNTVNFMPLPYLGHTTIDGHFMTFYRCMNKHIYLAPP